MRCVDGLFYFCRCLIAPCLQGFGVGQFLLDDDGFCTFQAILCEGLTLNFGADIARIVVLAVAGQAQDFGDDKLRGTPGTSALHGRTDHIKARVKVRAINRVTFEAVSFRAINKMCAGKFAVVRRGIGEMIVCRDDDERNFLDRGDIQAFVRCTRLHSTFANGR